MLQARPVLAVVLLATSVPAYAAFLSTFDQNSDGWRVVGDPKPTQWQPTGGNGGAYLYAEDSQSGQWIYFAAPDTWLGDWTGYLGGAITFDLRILTDSAVTKSLDVILLSGGNQITWYGPNPVHGEWASFSVPLTHEAFNANDNAFRSILSNVTGLLIAGEFTDLDYPEAVGLDNVRVPEPTTLALLVIGIVAPMRRQLFYSYPFFLCPREAAVHLFRIH